MTHEYVQTHTWRMGGWTEERFAELPADQQACIRAIVAGQQQVNDCGELAMPEAIDASIRSVGDRLIELIAQALQLTGRADCVFASADCALPRKTNAQIICVNTAIYEALTNAFRHGNRCDPRERFTLEVTLQDYADKVVIVVVIRNACRTPFYRDQVPEPAGEDAFTLHGHGLFQMQRFMDSVVYLNSGFHGQPGSCVNMTRELNKPKSSMISSAQQGQNADCAAA